MLLLQHAPRGLLVRDYLLYLYHFCGFLDISDGCLCECGEGEREREIVCVNFECEGPLKTNVGLGKDGGRGGVSFMQVFDTWKPVF